VSWPSRLAAALRTALAPVSGATGATAGPDVTVIVDDPDLWTALRAAGLPVGARACLTPGVPRTSGFPAAFSGVEAAIRAGLATACGGRPAAVAVRPAGRRPGRVLHQCRFGPRVRPRPLGVVRPEPAGERRPADRHVPVVGRRRPGHVGGGRGRRRRRSDHRRRTRGARRDRR
jgi:hypothetical protein